MKVKFYLEVVVEKEQETNTLVSGRMGIYMDKVLTHGQMGINMLVNG